MDKLTLIHIVGNGSIITDDLLKTTNRHYIDFVVSGHVLGQLIGLPKLDLVGTFGWIQNDNIENNQLDEFLGNTGPDLKTGRSCFFVCPECGDIECGAITAKIEVTETTVIWCDFGFENNLSEPDLSAFKHIGPFIFDKKHYFDTLIELKR